MWSKLTPRQVYTPQCVSPSAWRFLTENPSNETPSQAPLSLSLKHPPREDADHDEKRRDGRRDDPKLGHEILGDGEYRLRDRGVSAAESC